MSPNLEKEEFKELRLPDNQTVMIGSSRFKTAEALFNPSIVKEGDKTPGVHEMVQDSIQECDIDIRKELYSNVLVSGGTTLLPGFSNRLKQELDHLCPILNFVNVIECDHKINSPAEGAKIMSNLSTFQQSWITQD